MFIVEQARLARNKAARAKVILDIASVESLDRLGFGVANAFKKRELSLTKESEEMQCFLKKTHEAMLDGLGLHSGRVISSLGDQASMIAPSVQLLSGNLAHSYTEFEVELRKDLRTIRDHFETLFIQCREDRILQVSAMSASLRNESESFVNDQTNLAKSHYARVIETHHRGLETLETYLRNLIYQNQTIHLNLDRSIASLEAEITAQEKEIATLEEDNAKVSKPLKELQARERALREELEIVESGTMACRNFARSEKALVRKLESIHALIKSKQTGQICTL